MQRGQCEIVSAVPPTPGLAWRDGRHVLVLSVRVRGGELLRQGDKVVAEARKLGGKVVLGTREPDHLVDAAAGLHGVDPALDRLHAEHVPQEGVGVGEVFGGTLVLVDVRVVLVATAVAGGVELGDDEVARLGRALSRPPRGENEAELGPGSVILVARFEDHGLEAELPIGAEGVASRRLHAAASGSLGVEDDELAARAALGVDSGVHVGCARCDVDEAVVLGLGQGDDAAGDGLDAGRVEGAVLPLVPLGELTLGRVAPFGGQGLRVEGLPVAVTERAVDVGLGLGRERPGLDEALQRGNGGYGRGHGDSISG